MNNPTKKIGNKAARVQLSCRVQGIVKSLIALERKAGGFATEAEAVESLVFRASNSDAARALIIEEAKKDPHFSAIVKALSGAK